MIALDAMGGDFAPDVAVHGALAAARRGIPIKLFGDAMRLIDLLDAIMVEWRALPLEVVHCAEVIGMGEEPTRTVLHKKDSSLVRAVAAVADGQADAVVSAGNSGAALVAGTLLIGRVAGILRPAIGNFLPTKQGVLFCLDLGANADCKADYLVQFAIIGHCYAKTIAGIKKPRIALLSNGHEPYKGSIIIKETFKRLTELSELSNLCFVGNIEPRDALNGDIDVLVSDGFTGNIMLKSMQGALQAVSWWLKEEASTSWLNKIGLGLAHSAFNNIKKKTDYARTGGALLLGLNKPLVVAHGCSNAAAIEQALVLAHRVASNNSVELLNAELATWFKGATSTFTPSTALQQGDMLNL
jgi:glycerol-3-phosphate acyltransferase PlsX